ncbi:MAG: alpha/beta hydrolase [Acidobacteriota bacterium]
MSMRCWSIILLALLLGGCSNPVEWLGVRLLYEEAAASERVWLDLPYREDEGADPVKHRLDLFLPDGQGWPVLIFVHGGGWTAGDKALRAGGADVYRNIGRFYASQGIGTAVINYRLQPKVTWREQVDDVAQAIAWVRERATQEGGDADALFVMGHSAGAQLAAFVALDERPLSAAGSSTSALCGVIPVSGAGYDLADDETYDELGAERSWYEERFRAGDPGDDWLREASAISYVRADAPPFLLVHVTNEWESLQHQNRLLHAALETAGADSRLIVIPGQGHNRMVLNLSRGDRTPVPEVLEMIQQSDCGSG